MLRIIDANLDRAGEGLRVLEDVARFLLDAPVLSRRLKVLRHTILKGFRSMEDQLLRARNVESDTGAFSPSPEGTKYEDVVALVKANGRRVQESLRVLEELARLGGPSLPSPQQLEKARFETYELEQAIILALWRDERRKGMNGLYLVLDIACLHGRDPLVVAEQAIAGGVRVLQLRDKLSGRGGLIELARGLKAICERNNVPFIVNDYVDLALAVDAHGVHLGQDDFPVSEARRLLPSDRLVGCSTGSLAEAEKAQEHGADYIAAGAVFPTKTKDRAVLGLERLGEIAAGVRVPVIGIGGINENNVHLAMGMNIAGVAVISAILEAADTEEAARRLAGKIDLGVGRMEK